MTDPRRQRQTARSTAAEATERALDRIGATEHRVRAWAYLDAAEARVRAAATDREVVRPLTGLTVGVKDLIDVAGMPARYGSPIYDDHWPDRTAPAVSRLEDAGATVLGKTVTTEFALMSPGMTTNPRDMTRTPGGSSSGSAAAVAAGMVELAVGTQTYGSIIRPAGFCGVLAHKPTYGLVPVEGVKPLAPSFDTVGWFASSFDVLDAALMAVTGVEVAARSDAPRVGVLDVEGWAGLEPEVLALLAHAPGCLTGAGIAASKVDLRTQIHDVVTWHAAVGPFEIAQSLRWEFDNHRERLSTPVRRLLAGIDIDRPSYDAARSTLEDACDILLGVFDRFDVFVTPATTGEAPVGLHSTGDPVFCIPWSATGAPVITFPGGVGTHSLPLGLQLVGAPGRDAELLGWARALQPILSRRRPHGEPGSARTAQRHLS